MVVDTSALLAVFFDEPQAGWVAGRLEAHKADLAMSTVNLAETLILLLDRQPTLFPALERRLLESPIRFVPPSVEHARVACAARVRFPLNLGDCFAYALAQQEGAPLLTLDGDFRGCDIEVELPPAG